jgi:hypothetical protein
VCVCVCGHSAAAPHVACERLFLCETTTLNRPKLQAFIVIEIYDLFFLEFRCRRAAALQCGRETNGQSDLLLSDSRGKAWCTLALGKLVYGK